MSRSMKKTPCCIMAGCKDMKTYANRKVRRKKFKLFNNMSYKKLFESWNIVDWKDLSTREECKRLTDNEYKKYYVRK